MPRSGIAGSRGSSILSFLRNSIFFSIVAVPIYIPTNNVGGFPFLHTLSAFTVCRRFDDGHSDRWEVIRLCSFDLHFSDSNVEHLFMYFLAICMSSLEKCVCRSSAHFGGSFVWLLCRAARAVCIFWRLIPCCFICKYFLPLCGLSFHFVYGLPCCAEQTWTFFYIFLGYWVCPFYWAVCFLLICWNSL